MTSGRARTKLKMFGFILAPALLLQPVTGWSQGSEHTQKQGNRPADFSKDENTDPGPGICPKDSIPERLIEQLKREEGLYRNKDGQIVPYRDTRGRLLIGYGHNLDADAKTRQRRSPEDKSIPICAETTRTANGQPETNLPSIAEQSSTAEKTYYQSTPALEHNVQLFYFAVLKGDKQTAARHVHYPMRINSKPVMWIHNRKEFLRVYDRIFTRKFMACIDQGIPHDMFGNWQGWMIADGAIWFDQSGKVIALNPCPVTARRF